MNIIKMNVAWPFCLVWCIAAVHIYASVAASLAERKKGNQLTELMRNIKGTIEDDDWDQVWCFSN